MAGAPEKEGGGGGLGLRRSAGYGQHAASVMRGVKAPERGLRRTRVGDRGRALTNHIHVVTMTGDISELDELEEAVSPGASCALSVSRVKMRT